VKFVFNNKTILGALSLDMIAVLLVERCFVAIFAQDILKVGPQGWCFESRSAVGAFDADYLRLHSFYKKCWNEIIGSHFAFELHHCFGLSSIFGCPLPLYF
jgi:hypothetical protein